MANRIVKVVLRGEIADLQAKMAVAAKSVGATADKMTNASKESSKFRSGLTTLGSTAGKVGLVAAAGIGAIVVATANFEQSMSRVKAATHESASTMEDLRAAAIKAGADTVFSATEAADAVTALAKAGVSSKDILGGGLSGALALASAGELDVAQAAEIAATAMNQFGLAGKDIAGGNGKPGIVDLLAAGAAAAQGEVTDFAAALKFVGPVAHQMGISIEETTGVITELASQGILGEQAGTSLRGMLTALTSPSKLAATEMSKLGISLYDATGKFVGFDGVAGQLHDTMGGLSNAERDQALGRIFGNEQITAARILYAGGADAVEKWTKSIERDGAAADIAATKMDNLKGDLEQFKGSLETALIGAGGSSQAPLRGVVQGATDAVNALNNLPGAAKNAGVGLLGITAVTGGGLWFTAKAIKGVSDMRSALDNLGTSGAKAGSALKGIGLAGTSVAVLYAVATAAQEMQKSIDRSLPGVNQLTNELLALNTARGVQSLVGDIGDLSGALNQIKDPGFFNEVDKFYAKVPVLGKIGQSVTGAMLDVATAGGSDKATRGLREATASIGALDEALANITTSGSADQAKATFDQLATTYGLTSDQQKRLLDLMPQYKEALAGVAVSGKLAADGTGDLAGVNGATASSAASAAASTEDLAKALRDQYDAAVSAFDSVTQWRQALKDAEAQGKKSDAGIKGSSDEALANRDALSKLAGAWNNQTDAVKNTTGRFASARKSFIDTAVSMGVPRAAARKLAGALLEIPPKRVTNVSVTGAPTAISAVQALKSLMDSLHDRNININVTKHTNATLAEAAANNADGGTIHHAAAGWTVTGQRDPYGDKVLAYLAPGEEVITNRHGEADRFRADRAAGRIPAYSDGMPQPLRSSVSAVGGSSAAASRQAGYRDARDAHLAALRTALREVPIMQVPRDESLLFGAA